MKKEKDFKGIVGVSGEYLVAGELSQRGIVATLTLKNTPAVDVLATNLKNGKTANIQVKTMSANNETGWRLSKKDEEPSGIKNHFYILVNLKGPGVIPEYSIVSQIKLANYIKKEHDDWKRGKKKDGSKRKDTDIRLLKSKSDFALKHRDNWDILGLW